MRALALLVLFAAAATSQEIATPRAPGNGWIHEARTWPMTRTIARTAGEGLIHLSAINEEVVSLFEDKDGQTIAVIPLTLEGAKGIRIHFEEFHVSPGIHVYLYSYEKGIIRLAGLYTSSGPLGTGDFWSAAVAGERAIVEVSVPLNAASLPFTIREVASLDRVVEQTEVDRAASHRRSWYGGRIVEHRVVNGFAIAEGDIVLGRVEDLEEATGKSRQREGVALVRQLWPGGVVPYTVDPELRSPQRVAHAIAHWNEQLNGHIRLQPRIAEGAYVEFRQADPTTCSSYIGRTGSAAQPVSIGDFCGTGNIIHEIGHVLGLHHEHTRRDRDTHVRILRENIDPYNAFNFDLAADGQFLSSYDYGSIMHYGPYAFSNTGLPTIVTIPAGITIGQRTALSAGDIESVEKLYPETHPPALTALNASQTVRILISSVPSGRTLVIDGAEAVTPAIRDWTPGSVHQVSAPDNMVSSGKYAFAVWSDGGSREHSFRTPEAASVLTASYSMKHRVSAVTQVTTRGAVTLSPASTDGHYAQNSVLTITATPTVGNCFNGWTGTLAINDPSLRLTVNRAYRITGGFQAGSVTASGELEASRESETLGLSIAATSGCIWKASSPNDWITIVNPTGKSSAVLKVKVGMNGSASPRAGIVTVNGISVPVFQRGQ